jgi:hypothetical protein
MYRRSPLGILVSGVLVVVAVGFGVTRAFHTVDKARTGIEQAGGGASSGAGSGGSVIKAGNLAKAISAVRAKTGAGGQVLELRLEPGQAKFQVRDGAGAQGWTYSSAGDLNGFKVNLIGPGRIEDNVFPLARLNARTPERIVAGIHAKAPRYSLDDVQFMTLDIDPVTGRFVWSANVGTPGSGNLYQADLDGSNVRAPGEAGRGVADCIAKAAGDPVRIQACATP